LKTPTKTTSEPLLSLPVVGYSQTCDFNLYPRTGHPPVPQNILITKLTFNGDMNPGTKACPLATCASFRGTGIWVWQGENILIQDVLIKQFGLEGISISNGAIPPKDITMRRVR